MPDTADAAILSVAWTTTKARRGETFTYHVGSSSVSLTGVLTRPEAEQVDGEENIVYKSRNWDLLIDATWPAAAPAAFTNLEPSQGDKVVRDSDSREYYVQPSAVSGLSWRYSDGAETFRRVFIEER